MPVCKHCHSEHTVKNGGVRQKQRWLCKACTRTFVIGDARGTWRGDEYNRRKPLAVLLASIGLSFRLTAKVLGVTHSAVQTWFDAVADTLSLPTPNPADVDLITLDEMWHFIQKKQTNAGYGKPPIQTLRVKLDYSTWLLVSVIPIASSS